jgi:hypothetical protein
MSVAWAFLDLDAGVVKRFEHGHYTGGAILTHKAYINREDVSFGIIAKFRLTPAKRFKTAPVTIGGKSECQLPNKV